MAHPGRSERDSGARGGPRGAPSAGSPPAPGEGRLSARRCQEGRPRVRPGLPPPLAGGRRLGGSRPGSEASRPLPPPPDVRPARRGSGSLGSAPRRLSLSGGEAPASQPVSPRGRISSSKRAAAPRRRGVVAPRQPGWAEPVAPAGPFTRKTGGKAEKTKAKKVWGALGSCAPRRRESSGGGGAGEEDR